MATHPPLTPIARHFIPESFQLNTWNDLAPYFEQLEARTIDTPDTLLRWLSDWSELQAVVSEDACWRQIRMTCDTENKALEESFNDFCMNIEPPMKPIHDRLNRKLMASPALSTLREDPSYAIYLRQVENELDLFREANIPLHAELNVMAQQYGAITGAMSIEVDGKTYTLQQAARFLMQSNRALRESVYHKVNETRLSKKEELDTLFNQLLKKRHQVALNAGFSNYRDYKFKELGRFDYTVADCEAFHEAIRTHIVPLVDHIYNHKKKVLGLSTLKPFDVDAEPEGQQPLSPFTDGDDLLAKSIKAFGELNPYFAECLETMQAMNRFDLNSRPGKAPGGYNCPLAVSGAPFIFMNAAGTADDVVTMMHEGGHALHSFLSHPLPLNAFKEYPMEMAELASMSMELFSMDVWGNFYTDANELRRAKLEELERVLSIFPWIAMIDRFQHWLYTHPEHSVEERTAAWVDIHQTYSGTAIDWTGLESYRANLWQKQLHLFEVPFYYIEYGIAQLGALQLWRNYKQNAQTTLDAYMRALQLGGTRRLPELYAEAGIRFDFSNNTIQQLSEFVRMEIEQLMV
ncbi:MAG: M3 family oligoendopeptidase [Chitinophagaceae bacterium]|nr:M3 family oligoendopeptidase [Chitinophagaceae bacterium]